MHSTSDSVRHGVFFTRHPVPGKTPTAEPINPHCIASKAKRGATVYAAEQYVGEGGETDESRHDRQGGARYWWRSGIGRASALTFARQGARAVVADIAPEGDVRRFGSLRSPAARRSSSRQTSLALLISRCW